MKKWINQLTLIFLCFIMIQCSGNSQTAPEQVQLPDNGKIPISDRARRAIKKQAPLLQLAMSEEGFQLGAAVFMRIIKDENILELWLEKSGRFERFKSYPICYYSGGLGAKKKEGDAKSPEGFYYVKAHQMNPNSSFHLSFNIGYPNTFDRAHGYTGSALMVHGNCVSVGCYAMTDELIEEIYTIAHYAFSGGQDFFRIHIFPFRMTDEKLLEHKNSDWLPFWQNLQEGFRYFEEKHRPPNVLVREKKYIFE
jgi:murein L,D-transpeptidase YafK